jgi:hypothetical protein
MEVKSMTRSGPSKRSSDDKGEVPVTNATTQRDPLAILEESPLAHPMAPEDRLRPGEILVWFPTIRPPRTERRS